MAQEICIVLTGALTTEALVCSQSHLLIATKRKNQTVGQVTLNLTATMGGWTPGHIRSSGCFHIATYRKGLSNSNATATSNSTCSVPFAEPLQPIPLFSSQHPFS